MDGLAFVQMIERELKERKIPKQQFYKESGISSATFSQWRKQIYSPSSAAIKRIEEYFGVTYSLEKIDAGSAQKENAPAQESRDEKIERIYNRLKQLTPEQQTIAMAYIDGMIDAQ